MSPRPDSLILFPSASRQASGVPHPQKNGPSDHRAGRPSEVLTRSMHVSPADYCSVQTLVVFTADSASVLVL